MQIIGAGKMIDFILIMAQLIYLSFIATGLALSANVCEKGEKVLISQPKIPGNDQDKALTEDEWSTEL